MTRQGETPTGASAALSLVELRRHLVRRAGELAGKARSLRARGDFMAALRAQQHGQKLLEVARKMGQQRRP
jgi:hypothetical protein